MMTLTPGLVGSNELNVMYFDTERGQPEPTGVNFIFSFIDYGSVRFEMLPGESHPGHAILSGDFLPHAGRWRVTVEVQRNGGLAAVAAFEFLIQE
jgi:hypothetical protein